MPGWVRGGGNPRPIRSGSRPLGFPFEPDGFPFDRSGDPDRSADRNRDERQRTEARVDTWVCRSTAHNRTRHACTCVREVRLHDRETRARMAVEGRGRANGRTTRRRRKDRNVGDEDKVEGKEKKKKKEQPFWRKKEHTHAWIASQDVAKGRTKTCTCTCDRRIEEGSIGTGRERKGDATRKERCVPPRRRRSSQRG